MAMLEVKDLEVYYGMIQAIKGISFEVNQGEVIALIGANGAGKTTTLHTITGLLSPKKGSVMFEGTDITKIPAHKIVSMGMAHVPEGRRVFAELSVYENLKMGAYTRKDKNEIEESLANVYKRFPRLEERRNQMAGTLSGGEQQIERPVKVFQMKFHVSPYSSMLISCAAQPRIILLTRIMTISSQPRHRAKMNNRIMTG